MPARVPDTVKFVRDFVNHLLEGMCLWMSLGAMISVSVPLTWR